MDTLFTGRNLLRLDRVDSTNLYLLKLLAEKAVGNELPEGTIVIATAQEQGRGQRVPAKGTHAGWESEPGQNLTFSVLFRPTFLSPDEQFSLSKAVALAVKEFVESTLKPFNANEAVSIKWPNDIYIGQKKTAGILIENGVSGRAIGHSVVGVGININQERFSPDIPNPTSLRLAAGKEFDLEECFSGLCSFLESRYLQLRSDPGRIHVDYLDSLYRLNEWSDYLRKGHRMKGKIAGVAKDGKLILEIPEGGNIECDFKEVEFIFS